MVYKIKIYFTNKKTETFEVVDHKVNNVVEVMQAGKDGQPKPMVAGVRPCPTIDLLFQDDAYISINFANVNYYVLDSKKVKDEKAKVKAYEEAKKMLKLQTNKEKEEVKNDK